MNLLDFASRLRQRRLVQWVLAYLAGAWVLVQVAALLGDQFGWPIGLQRSITAVLGVGILGAVVVAWYHGEAGHQKLQRAELVLLSGVVLLAAVTVSFVTRGTLRGAVEFIEPAPAVAAPVPDPELASIAVLPFRNSDADPREEYFGESFAQELIRALANVRGLRVATAASSFRHDASDAAAAGRALRVQAVLTGSVRRAGDRIRVAVQLTDARNGAALWTDTYDGSLGDVFVLEDSITSAIVQALPAALRPPATRRRTPANPDAYDMYLRGIYHLRRTGMRSDSAIHYLERSVALDPEFALGYGALALAHDARNFAIGDKTNAYRTNAFVAVEKALALDPELAEAYIARGNLAWTLENGFPHEAAARDFQRARALNPNLPRVHEALGSLYLHVGLNERALAELQLALELDPHSEFARFRVPRVLLYLGRYEEAVAELMRGSGHANDWHWPLALWYAGRRDEALTAARAQLEVAANRSDVASVYALILAGTGNRADAERYIRMASAGQSNSHFHHAAYNIASAYALMGDRHQALVWLRRVAREGFPNYELFVSDPNLKSLHGNAQFEQFLADQKQLWERHARVL